MSEEGSIYVDDDHGGKETMHKAVSVWHLAAISFFYVCAGPFGQGEAMAAGGPKWTFVFTLITPIIFSIPLALMSSEQASRMPMCGGCNEWGFILGDFMGYTNCYVRTLCSIFDNPIYPVMVCDYLAGFIPSLEDHTWYRFGFVCLANLIVIILNVLGLEAVGIWSFVLTFIIVTPFVLFFCFGAKLMTADLVFADKAPEYGEVDWSLLVSTLIWQYSGFDTIAALAEETKNPKRTFPIGLGITIVLVTAVYILPTVVGFAIEPDCSQWESAGFGDVAYKLPYCGSGWLSHWINIAGVLSALSLLNVAISCTGRETYAGGLFGAFPVSEFFRRLDKNFKKERVPIASMVFMSIITIPFCFFDFEFLVEWSGLLTVIQQLIQVCSFIACRIPKCMRRMIRNRALKAARRESVELSSLEGQRDLDSYKNPEDHEEVDDHIPDKDDLKDKFVIPGGWIGVTITLVPIVACSIFLCVVCGWQSLLISCAMVVGMWILKGIDYGIRKLHRYCKRRRARNRRDEENDEDQSKSDHVSISEGSSMSKSSMSKHSEADVKVESTSSSPTSEHSSSSSSSSEQEDLLAGPVVEADSD